MHAGCSRRAPRFGGHLDWLSRGLASAALCIAGCMSTAASSQRANPATGPAAAAVPAPRDVLGFEPGDRPVRYDELVRYMQALDAASDVVSIASHGQTHEGRTLYHVIITSSANQADLARIKADNAKLADPRNLSDADQAAIIDKLPAIAWMAYSIHGDEISPADSAMQLMYRLASSEDDAIKRLRDEVVTIIDPMQNPDGRERYLANLRTMIGQVPNDDYQAMQHDALWAAGRTNHYLFDMNRDWLPLTQPESRGRVAALREWNPHFQVDSHEQGALDTYLFDPPREPINPRYSQNNLKWRKVFSHDQAGAFNQRGWSYYTREWLDDWYPGYTNAWGNLTGAISMLYEQASAAGQSVRQPAGNVHTYKTAVEMNVVSSLANLETLRANRREILRDFVVDMRTACGDEFAQAGVFLLPPGNDHARRQRLIDVLTMHGIEFTSAADAFTAQRVTDTWGVQHVARVMPAQTLIVKAAQPRGRLVRSILGFDPHMTDGFLVEERRDIEQGKGTRSYDITAWNLPMAYGLESYWAGSVPEVRAADAAPVAVAIAPANAAAAVVYGWVIDIAESDAMRVAGRLLQAGVNVRAVIEPFALGGHRFERGSMVIRRLENGGDCARRIEEAIEGTTVVPAPVQSALVEDGPDLGGQKFVLLQRPRIAVASQWPVDTNSFGSTWFMIDDRLRLPCSPVNVQAVGGLDLRRYNVLILPDGGRYGAVLTEGALSAIKAWIEAGGTLIAMGNAAAFLADEKRGISGVRLRSDALEQLKVYAEAIGRERASRQIKVDPQLVWAVTAGATSLPAGSQPATAPATTTPTTQGDAPTSPWASLEGEELKRWDQWASRFSPQGAFLRAELDPDQFLSFGLGDGLPVLFAGSDCFMSKPPVQTAARFVGARELRLSGLLWPEARHRIADTACATRESLGNGQVILFAGDPFFRAFMEGTGRMLQNAIILGPGLGASAPVPWE